MFDILPNFLTTLTILFPIYASHKALSAPALSQPHQSALLTPWLTYFLVLSLFHVTESYLYLLTYLPLYAYARLFAHIYLLLPGQNQGATYIYRSHIAPFLAQHETQIESFIAHTHTQLRAAGLVHVERGVEYVKTNLLGWPASPTRNLAAEAARAPPSSNNYVASLLGRFSPPFAAGDAASGTGAAAISGLLGTALAQASSLASAPSGSAAASRSVSGGGRGGGFNEALIPPNLSSDAERLEYIASRREQLRTLLGAFEREEETIHLASTAGAAGGAGLGVGGGSGRGSSMGRSKSEAEFETIGEEDAGTPPASGGAAQVKEGWGGWLFGKGKENRAQGRSSGVDVGR